jgi:hypothetical protein
MYWKESDVMETKRIRGVGLGMAGVGALFVAISLLANNGYWFLVTGTTSVLVGIVTTLAAGWLAEKVGQFWA